MSRVEVDSIQTKLKAAITSHQKLVTKIKTDVHQSVSLKKQLVGLQEEIVRLSQEQKKVVVKLRENLVSSVPQQMTSSAFSPRPPAVMSIGQQQLVSFPSQGGAAMLPVGMVALPVAQVQRSSVGMSLPLSHASSISFVPASIINSNMAFTSVNASNVHLGGLTTVASNGGSVAMIPRSTNISMPNKCQVVQNTGETFSSNPLVSGSKTFSCFSTSPGNNMIIQNKPDLINQSKLLSSSGTVMPALSGANTAGELSSSSLISLSNFINSSSLGLAASNIASVPASSYPQQQPANSSSNNNLISNIIPAASLPVINATNLGQPPPQQPTSSAMFSSFPHQPLVQPRLLLQQQQQILQMIQQQQQQQASGQRLASQMPIKVPQYTASMPQYTTSMPQYTTSMPQYTASTPQYTASMPQYIASNIRPLVSACSSTTAVQYCTIAPTPHATLSSSVKSVTSTCAKPLPSTVHKPSNTKTVPSPAIFKLPCQNDKPAPSKISTLSMANIGEKVKDQIVRKKKEEQLKAPRQPIVKRKEKAPQSSPKNQERKREEKVMFMHSLGLLTQDSFKELQNKKFERKRRTTANPNYTIGFQPSKRHVPEIWSAPPMKKARVSKANNRSANVSTVQKNTPVPGMNQHNHNNNNIVNTNEVEPHDSSCAVCAKSGRVLMCPSCQLVYHLECLHPALSEAPRGAWQCPHCLVTGKATKTPYTDSQARLKTFVNKKRKKEEEKRLLIKKANEILKEKALLRARSKELTDRAKVTSDVRDNLKNEEQTVTEDLRKISTFVKSFRGMGAFQPLPQHS